MSKSQKESYLKTNRRAKYEHFFTPYWIKKGFTEEQVISIIEERKNKAKIKAIESMKNNSDRTRTQLGYWIKKGFTEEEALIKLNKEQSTFSKQKCIEKYGEEKGIEIWKKRQDKWQQTLNSKSKEFLYE